MKFEAVLKKDDFESYDSLKDKCDSLKKALNKRDDYVAEKFEDVKEILTGNILPKLCENKDAGELGKFLETICNKLKLFLILLLLLDPGTSMVKAVLLMGQCKMISCSLNGPVLYDMLFY